MGWSDVVSNIAMKVPWERFMFRPRDESRALEQFAATLPAATASGPVTSTPTATKASAPTPNPTEIGSQGVSEASALSLATTEETIVDLNKRLAKEVYRFQLDLAAGCKIAGKPCDCCEKHPLFAIESMVEELVPMDPENPTYSALGQWIKANAHKLTIEASASGEYDQEYPHMAATMRAFRKDLMGTEKLTAMTATVS